MFLLFVDESGDTGRKPGSSDYFILSGIAMHENVWADHLERLISFRRRMRASYGLKLREEIHSSALICKPKDLSRIPKHERLAIMRNLADELSQMPDIRIINIVVEKNNKPDDYDVFSNAWQTLIQRFENTILNHNFPGSQNLEDKGIIIADNTDGLKLNGLLRRMRRHNPIPNQANLGYRNLRLQFIIEDPVYRDSRDSYFLQCADLTAYLLSQKYKPNRYFQKKNARNYFDRLDPVLCRVARPRDPQGIVMI